MSKKLNPLCVLFWFTCTTMSLAQDTDYISHLLPSGVSIGMTGLQLSETRKDVIKRTLSGITTQEQNYDLVERAGRATFSWYYVRNGVLSGYMRTTLATALDADQQNLERRIIIPDGSNIVKESDEKILRAERDLKSNVVTATRWKTATKGIVLYTVVTDQEITAIIFNPSNISRQTFFVSPDQKRHLDAQAEKIKQKLRITPHSSPNNANKREPQPTGGITENKTVDVPQQVLSDDKSADSQISAERRNPKGRLLNMAWLYLLAAILLACVGVVVIRNRSR